MSSVESGEVAPYLTVNFTPRGEVAGPATPKSQGPGEPPGPGKSREKETAVSGPVTRKRYPAAPPAEFSWEGFEPGDPAQIVAGVLVFEVISGVLEAEGDRHA
jgi:hypothetical protein